VPDKYGFPVKASEREALRALKLARGKPDDAERPPLTPFPGRHIKPTPGQLDVFGGIVRDDAA
jgi:hypothetical protein